MRLNLLNFVLAGGILCAIPVNSAFAQHAGGGAPAQTPSSQANNPNNPLNQVDQGPSKVDDKKFVKEAALGGMTEVELGKLATQKASSDAVKQFGQKMVDDHTKANEMLKQVASKESISIPETLDAKHQSRIDKLSKLSGTAFDKAYVKDQLKDHQNDVRDFQAEAQSGTDPNIKAFASSTLPTLQQHLEIVKGLNSSARQTGGQ